MLINLKLSNGFTVEAKIGFSWTSLFFGFFVPWSRGDIGWGILHFLITFLSIGGMIYSHRLDFPLFWILFPFFYNKVHIIKLLKKGYIAADENSANILIEKGWIKKY